jgi:hypothetical protein
MGALAAQSVLARQATHVALGALHNGVGEAQSPFC